MQILEVIEKFIAYRCPKSFPATQLQDLSRFLALENVQWAVPVIAYRYADYNGIYTIFIYMCMFNQDVCGSSSFIST